MSAGYSIAMNGWFATIPIRIIANASGVETGIVTMQKIEQISEIRRKNNDVWMRLLSLALEVAPERTRGLLREIADNDRAITRIMGEIANED